MAHRQEDAEPDDAEGEDDDYEDEDEEGSQLGTWDGAIAQAEAAGYARERFPLLAPALVGAGGEWHVEEQPEWSLRFETVPAWIDDTVYTRAKAWCGKPPLGYGVDTDTRDRALRWPNLATANFLINCELHSRLDRADNSPL